MSSDEQKPPNSPMNRDGDGTGVFVINMASKTGGVEEKKTYKLHKRRVIIGSALSSDIRIQQNSVSNLHAIIEIDEKGNATIFDMASATGVFVNDQKVINAAIKPGDKVRVGFAELDVSNEALKAVTAQLPTERVRESGHRKLFLNEEEDFRPLILEDERNIIQIFDYPDKSERSLQVVLYWGNAILDVQHHDTNETVTIGSSKKADLVTPQYQDEFPLVEFVGGAVVLNLRREMRGVIRSNGQMQSVEDTIQQLSNSPSGLKKNLSADDMAKIELGDISIFVTFSPRPPTLRRQRVLERDPLFTRLWMTSLLLTVAFVLLFLAIPSPEPLEVDELPERTATIIFKPKPVVKLKRAVPKQLQDKLPTEVKKPEPKPKQAKKEPPKPKPAEPQKPKEVVAKQKTKPQKEKPKVTKEAVKFGNKQAEGNEGEGARAKGAEGQRGSKTAKQTGPSQYKYRPKSGGAARTAGGGRNAGPNAGKGNVDLLKAFGGVIDKTLAKGATGIARSGGGGNAGASGAGEFDTRGRGGLGETGSGRGGGGTSETIAGLGSKGIGGGKTGTGRGDLGRGGNLVGGQRGRPVVQVGDATETVILGGLDRNVVDKIVKSHYNQIRYCWEKEGNPNLRGTVIARWIISATGRVERAAIRRSSMQGVGSDNVGNCLVGIVKRMVFPEPLGGGTVEVDYSFRFGPALRQ